MSMNTFTCNYARTGSAAAHTPKSVPFRADLAPNVQACLAKTRKDNAHRQWVSEMDTNTLRSIQERMVYEGREQGCCDNIERELQWLLKAKVSEAYRYRSEAAKRELKRQGLANCPAQAAKQKKRFQIMARLQKEVTTVFQPEHRAESGAGSLDVYDGTNQQFHAMMFWVTPN